MQTVLIMILIHEVLSLLVDLYKRFRFGCHSCTCKKSAEPEKEIHHRIREDKDFIKWDYSLQVISVLLSEFPLTVCLVWI